MRVDTCADEFGARGYYEIPAHTHPNEVKVVVVSPDIRTCAGDAVDPLLRIVLTGTGEMDGSDVGMVLKWMESRFLG